MTIEKLAQEMRDGNKKLSNQIINKLSKKMDQRFDSFAIMVNKGFQDTQDFLIAEIGKTEGRLSGRIDTLETNIARVEGKVDKAVHKEYTNLESRVTVIEKKVGLKK